MPEPTPPAGVDDLAGPLGAAMLLAAIAGFLDAHLYLYVDEVFVANQSGNVILFGMGAGLRNRSQVVGPAISLAFFVTGIALGTYGRAVRLREGRRPRPDLVLLVEAGLIVAVAVLLWRTDAYEGTPSAWVTYPALAIGAFAMGLQTAVLKRVGDVAVATTYESGAMAELGTQTALASHTTDPAERRRRHTVIKVLAAVVAAYALGAAISAAMDHTSWVLVFPVTALLGLAVLLNRRVVAGPRSSGI